MRRAILLLTFAVLLSTVVGLSGQFLTQNEVLPRHREDLKPAVP